MFLLFFVFRVHIGANMELRKLIEWNGDYKDIEKYVTQLGPRDTCLYLFAVGFEKFLSRVRKEPKEISKELNTTVAAVSAWKTGKNFPSFDKIVELIKLGMTLEEIFGERLAKVIEENSGFSGRVAELEKTIESQTKEIENLKRQVWLMEKMDELTMPPAEIANSKEYKEMEKNRIEVFKKMGLTQLGESRAKKYESLVYEMKKMKARLDKIENGNK